MMKKLIALLAVSTLVLSGCTWFQPAEEVEVIVDNTPVVEEITEMEMSEYINTQIGVKFEYPKGMHVNVNDREAGALYIQLGEEYTTAGYLMPMINIAFEREDYLELNKDYDGPFFTLQNACEDEDQKNYVGNCKEVSDMMTSYVFVGHMGDIGFGKYYYFANEGSRWPKAEIRTDLWSSELQAEVSERGGYDGIDEYLLNRDFDEEQLREIELVDEIANSFQLK